MIRKSPMTRLRCSVYRVVRAPRARSNQKRTAHQPRRVKRNNMFSCDAMAASYSLSPLHGKAERSATSLPMVCDAASDAMPWTSKPRSNSTNSAAYTSAPRRNLLFRWRWHHVSAPASTVAPATHRATSWHAFSNRRHRIPEVELLFFRGLRHHVAGSRRKPGAFQLHCGVIDPKTLCRFFLNRNQDAFAFIHVHVRNARMQAQRVVSAAQRPDVHVVNFLHALDSENRARHFFHVHFARPPLQQNVRGFPQNSYAGPQHQQTNRETKNRVEPLRTRNSNGNRPSDDRDIGKCIAKIMNQNAAQIQIVPSAHQRQRNSAVDTKRSQRSPYHPALDDLDRRAQSFQRFVTEPQRKKHQQDRKSTRLNS